MATTDTILEAQKALETKLTQRLAEFDAALRSATPKADTIASLSSDFKKFKELVWSMLTLLKQQIAAVCNSVDAQEMRHRRKYLLLGGISESEKSSDAESVVSICRDRLQLTDTTTASFSICHRLGTAVPGRTRPILVRCLDLTLKESIWKKKSMLKGSPVVLSEFLTKHRQAIFLSARKHFGMRSVWTQEGNIFVKLPSSKAARVLTIEQLNKLMAEHPAAAPAAAKSSSAAPAQAASTSTASAVASAPMESMARTARRVAKDAQTKDGQDASKPKSSR